MTGKRERQGPIWFALVKGKMIRESKKSRLKKILAGHKVKDVTFIGRGQEYEINKVTEIDLVATNLQEG